MIVFLIVRNRSRVIFTNNTIIVQIYTEIPKNEDFLLVVLSFTKFSLKVLIKLV